MKYAFLTTLIPKQTEEETRRLSKHNMQDAANALQWHIFDGLCENYKTEIKIFNVLPIGSFPQYYSKPFIKQTCFSADDSKENINIGFCNVKFIRKLHQPKRIYKQLVKWCQSDSEEKCLFVYTISAQFMTAVAKLKKKCTNLKVCAIIADLPDMSNLSNKMSLALKLFNKKSAAVAYDNLNCVDAFVLLTKQMADYLHISKPYVVMEGISTETESLSGQRKENGLKTILYSGTLHEKFGVLTLVRAFEKIPYSNYRLVICGVGDSEDKIRVAAAKDERISFLGQLKREEVLRLQQEASVLVNPRQNNEEFTKYSFPSKNLEYLSSGIPLVAYKLDGIPDEYDEYINYVNDNSVEGLRDMLIDVCENADGLACERAKRAVCFVKNEKNSQKQTLKIKRMIESL